MESFAHFELLRPLGKGGMGVVYAARDTRLGREVAIKMLHEAAAADPPSRDRLWREARTAAGMRHPRICQIFEAGEVRGQVYLVMELLEGRSLAERIAEGALAPAESLALLGDILDALEALHGHGFVHRDLKPSNVFLTSHGPKLLDFGLARPIGNTMLAAETCLTMPGIAIGTPRYMAPEQWAGEEPGPACDLFAAGAILFEMLTGRPAFDGRTVLELHHAIVHEQPPALAGGPEAMACDRIILRALAKRAEDRYATAAAMAAELRAAQAVMSAATETAPVLRATSRLIVLPLRILRPDPDTDFLAFSIPDALTSALSGLESLVVRPSAAALRWRDETPDFARIAAEAAVDAVVSGTLLRAGAVIRVTTELVGVPAGVLLCSHAAQVSMGDVFQLQETLVARIVDALAIPLSGGERGALHADAPATPLAYEYFLRANQLFHHRRRLAEARDLYRRCVEEDPRFAPAWARLGRVCRVLAKYGGAGDPDALFAQAEEAFGRALALNPDLSVAHNLYTFLELEELGRSREAMVRLIERAHRRHTDPELFAGLVATLRFGGLLEASLTADRRARRLDPGIRTSVAYSWWMLGDYERAAASDEDDVPFVRHYALAAMGREAEAVACARELEASGLQGILTAVVTGHRAAVEGSRAEVVAATEAVLSSRFRDPEGLLFKARNLSRVGEGERALELLERVVRGGFFCAEAMRRDAWLAPLRGEPRLQEVLRRAEEGHREAAEAYAAAGGPRLFGV